METLDEAPEYQISAVFKSYYVVWKPTNRASAVPALTSLNRTMQYGNEKKSKIKKTKSIRLNRTMQYGNQQIVQVLCLL